MTITCWKCGAAPSAAPSVLDVPSILPAVELNRLLTSNEVPLDARMTSIRTIVSEGQDQIDTLNAQIDSFQARAAGSKARRDSGIRSHAPGDCIPNPSRAARVDLPDIGIGVAERWRSCSQQSSLVSTQPTYASPGDSARWQLLIFGASSPLSSWSSVFRPEIDIYWEEHPNADRGRLYNDEGPSVDPLMLDIVLPHCARWRTLHLKVGPYLAVLDWLQSAEGHLDRLEVLEITDGLPVRSQPASSYFDYAEWGSFAGNRHSLETNYPLQRKASQGAFEILKDASDLQEEHLRRFSTDDSEFLAFITAPFLEGLFLPTPSNIENILPFVHRSSCALNSLVLTNYTIPPELVTALRGLPFLTRLFIESADSGKGVQSNPFKALSISDGAASKNVCPSLTALTFGYGRTFPQAPFFAMARRSRVLHYLSFLRIFCVDNPDDAVSDNVADQLESLRSEGLDTKFLGGSDVRRLKQSMVVPSGASVDWIPRSPLY
ncbi:hypothetical protein B0H19DRAFT_1384746 [Mycena capillaripes]|nr:hypothetical protein B0H19DRAFT_1384746 [Mycena capillaripes]